MKDRYDSLIEEGDKASTSPKKLDAAWVMLKMIGTNHLPTIEGKVNKIYWMMMILLLAVLFSSKDSISWLWMAIMKVF